MERGLLSAPLQAPSLKKMFKGGQNFFILFYRWKKLWIVSNRVYTYICPLQSLIICTLRGCFQESTSTGDITSLPEETGQVTTILLMKMGPLELAQ